MSAPRDDDDGPDGDEPYCPYCSGFGPHGGGYCEECGEGNGPRDDGN